MLTCGSTAGVGLGVIRFTQIMRLLPAQHENDSGRRWRGLPAAVAEAAFDGGAFVFREEAEADGDLRAVKELAGEGDHAVHEVGLDEGAADVAFAGLLEDMLSLTRTKPAMLWGARWWTKCCTQAKLPLPAAGAPY